MLKIKYSGIIILVVTALSISGCGKKDPSEEAGSREESNKNSVKQKILAFDLEGLSDRGTKKWDVKGESAESISENELKLANIIANTYGDSEATISADEGIYDKSKNSVRLEKNVKAVINSKQDSGGDMMDFSSAMLSSAKSTDPKADKSKKTNTVITCDGEAQFDYENSLAYFNKNVKVVSDDGNIDADKITANLDITSKKVEKIVAEGNVKITSGENITYSDKATYIESERKIVLTGRPKLILYQEGDAKDNFFGDDSKPR